MSQGAIRKLLWIADAGLLAVCALLAAHTAGGVLEGLRGPDPVVAGAAPPPAVAGEVAPPEVIVTRNLFAPPARPAEAHKPQPEDVEATQLPVGLLGTAYSPDPDLSRAAVWNALRGEHRVVAAGDEIADGEATVLRIERERILLTEAGHVRELSLEDTRHHPPTRAQNRARLEALQRARRNRH